MNPVSGVMVTSRNLSNAVSDWKTILIAIQSPEASHPGPHRRLSCARPSRHRACYSRRFGIGSFGLASMASMRVASHIAVDEQRWMAGGWTRDGAVQDQIDDTVADAVIAARASMPSGESEPFCAVCGDDIPEGRRSAIPGVRTCVACQSDRDRPLASAFNRRGSKDSQLR